MNKTKSFKKLAKLFFVSLSVSAIISLCAFSLLYIVLITDEKGMAAFSAYGENISAETSKINFSCFLCDKRLFML